MRLKKIASGFFRICGKGYSETDMATMHKTTDKEEYYYRRLNKESGKTDD